MRRYVIVGSGPAGISAAEAIRTIDAAGQITLISEDPHGYYSRPGLAYLLADEIPEKMLFPFSEVDFKRLELRWIKASAVKLDPAAHMVELNNGLSGTYDRLLIATGSSAIRIDIPGSDAEGVVKLDNLDDARGILKRARPGRKAVVTGGGITALEIVEGLKVRGVQVHYVMRGDRYWTGVIDETESNIVEHRLKEEKVQIYHLNELTEILVRGGKVSGVRLKGGQQIACDMVAAAIGIRPRLDLARSGGLECERGILVSDTLQSSEGDVFAAGDVAQVYDPFSGKSVLDSLWGPAREQGRHAGLNMAGTQSPYRKLAAFNVTRLAGLTTTLIGSLGNGEDKDLIGIARGDSEVYRQLPDAITAQDSFDVNRVRMMITGNTIAGALVMGDQTLSKPLQDLVAHKVDISTVRDRLMDPDAALGQLVTRIWAAWKQGEGVYAAK